LREVKAYVILLRFAIHTPLDGRSGVRAKSAGGFGREKEAEEQPDVEDEKWLM